jgi:hypothetical protein
LTLEELEALEELDPLADWGALSGTAAEAGLSTRASESSADKVPVFLTNAESFEEISALPAGLSAPFPWLLPPFLLK